MSALQNKIDFVALVSVTMANANGDPLNGNRPRTDYNGFSEISNVCIKRKLRNRMQDLGHRIFVQSDGRCGDGCKSLSERAFSVLKNVKDRDEYAQTACETWLDVRAFGQVFAFKDAKGVSCGVRGPVSIHQAASLSPVEIESMQITKSVNRETSGKSGGRSSDTMGMKHFVRFGLYEIKGSINVQLAEKTGFSYEDAQVVKECLHTLFVNDASSGGGQTLLVGAQLQGRPVFFRKSPSLCEGRPEARRRDPSPGGGLRHYSGAFGGVGSGNLGGKLSLHVKRGIFHVLLTSVSLDMKNYWSLPIQERGLKFVPKCVGQMD